jgi:hypothetical protein
MCDISKELRQERYKELRMYGYKRGFAQRARDFTYIRYKRALTMNKLDIEIANIYNDGQQWGKNYD